MDLAELTQPELIETALEGDEQHMVLRALAQLVAKKDPALDTELLVERLEQREALGSTGIGHGVAVPHCRMKGFDQVVLAIGVSKKPVPYDALDGAPVRLFFLVISPYDRPAAHLRCLAGISRWVKDSGHIAALLAVENREALYAMLPGANGAAPSPISEH